MSRITAVLTHCPGSYSTAPIFQFFQGSRPVFAKEAAEAAVGEDFAAGLAAGAVVGFVVGVADALDFCAAAGAGLAVAAVDGHAFAEGGHFFGEFVFGFGAESGDPVFEGVARGGVESLRFLPGVSLLGEDDGRELGGVEDFVGVGVADAAEEARVGEGALEGVVFVGEGGARSVEVGGENVDAAGVERGEAGFVADEVEGGAAFGSRLR